MYKSAVVQRFFSFSLIITQIKGSGKPKRQPSQLNRRLNKKSLFYFKFQANLVLFQSSNCLERKTVSENCSARLPVQKVEHKIKIRSFLSKTCWVLIGGHAQCQVTQAIDGQKPLRFASGVRTVKTASNWTAACPIRTRVANRQRKHSRTVNFCWLTFCVGRVLWKARHCTIIGQATCTFTGLPFKFNYGLLCSTDR